jgi:ATP-binding cassette subfamily B protein
VDQSATVYDKSIRLAQIRAVFNPFLDFLPAVGLVAVLWYGGREVLAGHLTLGELVAFNVYVFMLIPPLRMTGQLIAQAQRAVAASERIDQILRTAPEIVDRPDPLELPPGGGGELRFEDVDFAYIAGSKPVLHHFNLVVKPGESVAIVGATGTGKTTVARLIPRFYDVDGGRVLIDGVDVRDVKVRHLRQNVGIVFEDTFLFSDSIRSNIAFADPAAPQEQVERAAFLAGAHEFISQLPDGYDTLIGERGFSLSGGQRQRIALARAILADPRVLILDDATSSVDPTKEHEIREALAEVMRGRTTIVIAHRPATIALADRIVLLEDGHIIVEGTHDQLLETSEEYRAVLARQIAGEGLEEVSA